MTRLAISLIVLMITAGCGAKGDLEPPPGASSEDTGETQN
jgi:predicted small lipoprotein YifL